MTNAINMLPCPMCECSSINVKNEQPTDNSGGYFIECPDCGISTSLRYACGDDPIPLLAEQWNRRATAQCLHHIAEPAQTARPAFEAISQFMKCEWSLDWDKAGFYSDVKVDAAFTWFEKGYMRAQHAAAPQAVQAAVSATNHSETPNSSTIIVPYGWKLVPDDATPEWVTNLEALPDWREAVGECIKRFLAAAPAHPAEGVPAQAVELEVDDLIDRLLNAQQDLNLAANVHMDQSIASASTLLDEVEIALRTLAATQPAAQGVDVVQAAKALCKHAAKVQNVNFDDYWLIHAEDFKEEAQIVLDAAQAKHGDGA